MYYAKVPISQQKEALYVYKWAVTQSTIPVIASHTVWACMSPQRSFQCLLRRRGNRAEVMASLLESDTMEMM